MSRQCMLQAWNSATAGDFWPALGAFRTNSAASAQRCFVAHPMLSAFEDESLRVRLLCLRRIGLNVRALLPLSGAGGDGSIVRKGVS